ncbi:MAG: molybdopterin molybdenumtransferase MoeA [Methanobacteriales archaeon HGW-Methanobacteriales-1]|jgi:molybdopterin molybdotransferase|nr:MAG: molybdopterin molybdenumtransferase MoeA [Methanobacteriales archaeon HGW-Methanobacteriales-1]
MYHDNLIPVKEAQEIVKNCISPLKSSESEIIILENANQRILAQDIKVLMDVPPFDRSAMDGYAVKSEDTGGASSDHPVKLKIVDKIGAGSVSKVVLKHQEAIQIATGAPMPEGADAIIMQEFTHHEAPQRVEEYVYLEKSVKSLQDVSEMGEDLKEGEIILKKGQLLSPHLVALIASCGYRQVEVYKKPVIGVLITGSELVEPSPHLKPGMIINSNKYALKSLIEDCKAIPIIEMVPDDLDELTKKLEMMVDSCDAVITTGGTAVSEGDLIVDLVEEKGEVLFHGVSIKPGKPFAFGKINETPVFMLSGYPVAVAVQFDIFVRESIFNIQNIDWKLKTQSIIASSDIRSSKDKFNVTRAFLKDNEVQGLRTRAGINKSITESNCYVISPEGKGKIKKGNECQVVKYSSLNIC